MKTIELPTTLKINRTPNGSLNRTKTSPVITEIFVISVYPLCKGAPHTWDVKKHKKKKTKNKTPAAPIVPVCISQRCHLTNFKQAAGKRTGETRGITITPATTLKKK